MLRLIKLLIWLTIDTVLEKSDILVILVNHREFYSIDREKLSGKVLIDVKGVFK